ncbi:MAG TPA: UDP-3-O-(3-hydroxymyristoyl)glucosamine N-acyltransferase [Thermoanaerobaculia bacterium]|nr:UDP-3-O-(3-hydroxymyristoyl)glucosamine N-acyltransferase [Thermoanaerobaculia bacterium]
MGYRLAELAELVEGRVEGDPERAVETIRILEEAGPGDLSFLTSSRYRAQAVASRAGALLVGKGLADRDALGRDLLVVEDPGYALAVLLARFHPDAGGRREPGVHPTAILEPGCVVDPAAHVGPYVVIGEGSRIGAGATLHAFVAVGRSCTVGEGAVLFPHAVLYDGTELGAGVVVHAGVVLGADGFGYATHGGAHHKVPQLGRVVIEANVEVGANSTIDRATLGATRIGEGTKIDNLVQVGHNVQVGRHSILCGQAGIAGSAKLGDGVVLAGQAGVAGHIELGNRVQVAAKSAALASVEEGTQVAGIPAVEIRKWRRQTVLISRLEEMGRRLRALERRLGELGESGDPDAPGDTGEEG